MQFAQTGNLLFDRHHMILVSYLWKKFCRWCSGKKDADNLSVSIFNDGRIGNALNPINQMYKFFSGKERGSCGLVIRVSNHEMHLLMDTIGNVFIPMLSTSTSHLLFKTGSFVPFMEFFLIDQRN